MAKQAKSANKVVASSGNVFADLGLPDAAELDTKVRLAVAVNRLLESRRLTQAATQPPRYPSISPKFPRSNTTSSRGFQSNG